jgi:hypothetical protein
MMALVEGILLIKEQHIKFSGCGTIGPHSSKMKINMSRLVIATNE